MTEIPRNPYGQLADGSWPPEYFVWNMTSKQWASWILSQIDRYGDGMLSSFIHPVSVEKLCTICKDSTKIEGGKEKQTVRCPNGCDKGMDEDIYFDGTEWVVEKYLCRECGTPIEQPDHSPLKEKKPMDESYIVAEVLAELERAQKLYGDFKSYHDGLSIIQEEVEELKDEVYKKTRNTQALYEESLQVAAMGLKMMLYVREH